MYAQILSSVGQPGCLTSIVVTEKKLNLRKHKKIKKKNKPALMN